MNEQTALSRKSFYRKTGAWITLLIFIVLALGIFIGLEVYQHPIGPAQPIPFSHRIHAGEKQISCLVCHTESAMTSTGGVPPLQTCMHCHSRIITSFAPIKDLHKHFNTMTPVVWNKVTKIPEFVYFPHSIHLNRGIDCSRCHGDVKKMDRIVDINKINMGFCIQCHRDYNAPVDCFTCHR